MYCAEFILSRLNGFGIFFQGFCTKLALKDGWDLPVAIDVKSATLAL